LPESVVIFENYLRMPEKTEENKDVIILGAGLVGSLLSICLSRKGYAPVIFEKRHDPRNINTVSEGRSINLALSDRGLRALDMAGLKESVLKDAVPMKGRMVHDADGHLHFYPYGEEGKVIYSVSRACLNKTLINEAERNNVPLFFDHKCTRVYLEKKCAEILADTEQVKQVTYRYLFGADGVFSRLRHAMQSQDGFNFSQQYINYGYKELHLPAAAGKHILEANALHIWPRGEFMLIALPNKDGSFTCTLFLPFGGTNSFESIESVGDMTVFFERNFRDVLPWIPELEKDFFSKPPSSMVTIRCHPWVYNANAALIGDAAHAIVPFFGQGMNAGFEDVTVLMELLNKNNDLDASLDAYNKSRNKNTDAIGELALQNFIEMRDLVTDPHFILRKKIESEIHKSFPRYDSLYSMVTFSDMPYATAWENGKKQDEMFREILALPHIASLWNTEEGWRKVKIIFRKYFDV
jgi:kynurenine 3-monooxygenase